jgi:hypothetical protein
MPTPSPSTVVDASANSSSGDQPVYAAFGILIAVVLIAFGWFWMHDRSPRPSQPTARDE